MATAVELSAPILLLFGFATRLGAAAMLGMTIVIQTFVYPESYPTHLLWAARCSISSGAGLGPCPLTI